MIKISILFIALVVSSFLMIDGCNKSNKEIRQCGTVITSSSEAHMSKSTFYYNQYLLIDFDSTGLEAINVDMTTFLSHKKGDRVCFMLDEYQMHSPDAKKHKFLFRLGMLLSTILLIVIIVTTIFDKNSFFK